MLILFLLDFWIFEYTYFKLVSQERVCVCWLVEYLSLPKSISLLPISSRTYTVLNKIQCGGRSDEELVDLTSEVTPWKKLENRHLEILGSRHCRPATEALQRGRNKTELSPKQQDPTKRFGRRNQGPTETKVSPSRQNYWKIWAIQDTEVTPPDRFEGTWQYIRRHLAADTEVTPPDRLKVLGSTLGGTWQQTVQPGDWSSTQRQERHRD